MKEAIIKFNGGDLALLCSECRVIIKTGKDFTEDEIKAAHGELKIPAQFCDNCTNKNIKDGQIN